MYKLAYAYDELIIYFDIYGNKYVIRGGNLAWRINNPGLVRSHSHFAKKNGSIGSCGRFAIFADPEQGLQALRDWLHSKKYYNSTLAAIIKHYQSDHRIGTAHLEIALPQDKKIKAFTRQEFDQLLLLIKTVCGYRVLGNEKQTLLPKITAKIENGEDKEDTYLIGNDTILSKAEAIEWISSYRLDGVVVCGRNGNSYLRSRPLHCIWNIRVPAQALPPLPGLIDTLVRIIGEKKSGQCIWGFINGIKNSKDEALKSSLLISDAANGEAVFSMPNDTEWGGIKDIIVCLTLKSAIDTPIVSWTIKFFRYLLALSEQDGNHSPVIVFAHSQGAIITEHALELLTESERQKIRIFTFGGGSFIAPDKSHPDSHNYASAADLVCRLGSPNLQLLALERYHENKKGLNQEQVIQHLAMKDVLLHIDSTDPRIIEAYRNQRIRHYNEEFARIRNITVLDPDPGELWKHKFSSECYQAIIHKIINKYQRALLGGIENEQVLCTV